MIIGILSLIQFKVLMISTLKLMPYHLMVAILILVLRLDSLKAMLVKRFFIIYLSLVFRGKWTPSWNNPNKDGVKKYQKFWFLSPTVAHKIANLSHAMLRVYAIKRFESLLLVLVRLLRKSWKKLLLSHMMITSFSFLEVYNTVYLESNFIRNYTKIKLFWKFWGKFIIIINKK